MKSCPNINTVEWKELVSYFGNKLAYKIYTTLNEYVPTLEQLEKLKKDKQLESLKDKEDLKQLNNTNLIHFGAVNPLNYDFNLIKKEEYEGTLGRRIYFTSENNSEEWATTIKEYSNATIKAGIKIEEGKVFDLYDFRKARELKRKENTAYTISDYLNDLEKENYKGVYVDSYFKSNSIYKRNLDIKSLENNISEDRIASMQEEISDAIYEGVILKDTAFSVTSEETYSPIINEKTEKEKINKTKADINDYADPAQAVDMLSSESKPISFQDGRLKILIPQVGKELAERTLAFYGKNFNPIKTTDLKKALGIRNNITSLSLNLLYKKIGEYNRRNGTSHKVEATQIGQADLYKVELKANYLPVNISKYEQNLKSRFDDSVQAAVAISSLKNGETLSPIIKSGVQEVFESNPELANAVYQSLIPEGYTRLYRVRGINEKPLYDPNSSNWVFRGEEIKKREKYFGRWFSKDITDIEWYKKDRALNGDKGDFSDVEVVYVDVLTSDLEKYTEYDKTLSRKKEDEFVLPQELVDKAINFENVKLEAQQLYSQYLDTVFPDSKVKDIVYHGTLPQNKFEKFDKQKGTNLSGEYGGIHFGDLTAATERPTKIVQAENFLAGIEEDLSNFKPNIIPTLLNITNIKRVEEGKNWGQGDWSKLISKEEEANGFVYTNKIENKGNDSYVVFEPEQIHILGSKQDIEGFNNFLNSSNETLSPKVTQKDLMEDLFDEEFLFDLNQDLVEEYEEEYEDANGIFSARGVSLKLKDLGLTAVRQELKDDLKAIRSRIQFISRKIEDFKDKEDIVRNLQVRRGQLKKEETDLLQLFRKEIRKDYIRFLDEYHKKSMAILDKIMEKPNMAKNEMLQANRIIKFWQKVFENSSNNKFLDPEKTYFNEDGSFTKAYYLSNEIKLKLESYDNLLTAKKAQLTRELVKNESGKDLNDKEITRGLIDFNKFTASVLDISKINHPLIQTLEKMIRSALTIARDKALKYIKIIDNLADYVMENNIDINTLFSQSDSDNKRTGRLVGMLNAAFNEDYDILSAKEKVQFLKKEDGNNLTVLNPYYAMAFALGKRKGLAEDDFSGMLTALEAELKEIGEFVPYTIIGGKVEAEFYNKMAQFKQNIIDDKDLRSSTLSFIKELDAYLENAKLGKKTLQDTDYNYWKIDNSPFSKMHKFLYGIQSANTLENFNVSEQELYNILSNIRIIPVKNKKYYEKKYTEIMNDTTLKDAYFKLKTILTNGTIIAGSPDEDHFSSVSLPFLRASLGEKLFDEAFSNESLLDQMNDFTSDAFRGIWSVHNSSLLDSSNLDPLTNTYKDRISVPFSNKINYIIRKELAIEEARILATTKKEMSVEAKKDFIKKLRAKLAEESSPDIIKLAKVYSIAITSYMQKSAIEDSVLILKEQIDNLQESVVNKAGMKRGDKETSKNALRNIKEMVDNHLDVVFYGKPSKAPGKLSSKTKYTKEEKEQFDELQVALEELKKQDENVDKENQRELYKEELDRVRKEFDEKIETAINQTFKDALIKEKNEELAELREKISRVIAYNRLKDKQDSLGYRFSFSQLNDSIISWMRLKSLGWNVFASVSNLFVAINTNFQEAVNGTYFDEDSMVSSLAMFMRGAANKDGRTYIDSMMKKFDVLKLSKEDLYTSKNESMLTRKYKALKIAKTFGSPLSFQNNTEYVNQATVLLAMMHHEDIVDISGNTHKLIKAFDKEGNLKPEFRTEDNIAQWESPEDINSKFVNFKIKVDDVVAKIHGNYNPNRALLANKEAWSRTLLVFKRWMIEGYYNRFGMREWQDSYSMQVEQKGRYWSLYDYTKGELGEESIANRLQHLGKMLLWTVVNNNYNALRITGALVGIDSSNMKLGRFDSEFGNIDEKETNNIRAALAEIMSIMQLMMMMLLAKMAYDDEDDKEKGPIINILLNIGSRITGDVSTFLNVATPLNILTDGFITLRLVDDIEDFSIAVVKALEGKDTLESGPMKGHSRLEREFLQLFPGGSSYQSIRRSVKGELKKPQSFLSALEDSAIGWVTVGNNLRVK